MGGEVTRRRADTQARMEVCRTQWQRNRALPEKRARRRKSRKTIIRFDSSHDVSPVVAE